MASKGPKSGQKTPAPVAAKTPAVKPAAADAAKPAPAKGAFIKADGGKPVAPTVTAAAMPAATKPAAPAPAKEVPVAAAAPTAPVAKAAPVSAPAIKPASDPAPVVASAAPASVASEPTPAVKPTVVAPVTTKQTPTTQTAVKKETTMETTLNNVAEKGQAMFSDMNDRAKAAIEKTQGLFADLNEFNKGNVEAIVESSKIAAKGIESMGQDAAEYTRKSFEHATSVIKTLASVKSPTEFMKLHSDYVRQSFDSMVAESSKTTETVLKLAGEIAQPISNRVAVAAEKIKLSA